MIKIKHLIILLPIIVSVLFAQTKKLSFEQAYLAGNPKLLKPLPTVYDCEKDNSYLEKRENKIVKILLPEKEEEVIIDFGSLEKEANINLQNALAHNKGYSEFILKTNNDLFLYRKGDNKVIRLTNDNAEEKNPVFSPNEKQIAYTKKNNLYILNLLTKKERQLTFDTSHTVYNGYASWVYYEEVLGRASHYRAFYWSPNSKQIVFMRFDDKNIPTFTLFNADGVHGKLEVAHYPKAGDPLPEVKLGIITLQTGKTAWIDSTVNKGNLIAWAKFTGNGEGLLYQRMNRGQDSLEIMFTGTESPSPEKVYSEQQNTWVEFIEDLYPLGDNTRFIFRSEINGWYHLYLYNYKKKELSQITKGDWSVTDVAFIDKKTETLFFHAGKESSLEKHLYKISFNGKNLTKLTDEPGTHNCTVLKGGKYFLDKYSSVSIPPRLYLYDISKKTKELLANSKLPEMDKYNLGKIELFNIPTEDGYKLPAKWVLPPNFDKRKKYPVIISIYGGPGVAIVKNSFSRRGLGSYFLAQNGIIVLNVDNRGSGHFGKKGKNELFRNLGKREIDDFIEAAKWLRKQSFIDTAKIAITGGSYGGYVTSMALARAGKYFKYGIAKYAVTDWRLYDNIYTERYMDTPSENPEGYKYGSVMNYAGEYNGGMLITHGTMDDNVHMQNTLQLIDKLENLNKDFEVMIYPNQRHGIRFPKYSHSMKLDVKFWFKNLLTK